VTIAAELQPAPKPKTRPIRFQAFSPSFSCVRPRGLSFHKS
jgi:hypothetical protein